MFKTFLFGIVLGAAATVGALYALPLVDQHRETSLISVAPNGGTNESFHIDLPDDRIMTGHADATGYLPEGLQWPQQALFANVRMDMFKLRNADGTVVGLAARTQAVDADNPIDEWVIHLPARGSAYFLTGTGSAYSPGVLTGSLRAGSREFLELSGSLSIEHGGEAAGRISLQTMFLGAAEVEGE